MASQFPKVGSKFGERTMGHFELFLNQLSPADQEAVIHGDKKLIAEIVARLFLDRTGRCIPAHLEVASNVCDESRNFHVELPDLGYAEIRELLVKFFPKGTKFASANEFEDTAEALKAKNIGNELVGNFFKRAKPIMFAKHDARKNMGTSLQKFILPAVKRAYEERFKSQERKFVNYRDGELAEKVSIISETGHDELVSLMAKKSVVAWYSPNPFQGFSIFAQREAMKILKQYGFALAGGVDTGTAAVPYVGEMARDCKTPVYTCSALLWRSSGYSLYFCADDDDEFHFGRTDNLSHAYDGNSGGLVLFR